MEKTTGKKLILGIQHVLAMFGATVLVPALTGLNTSITLICAGLGTLLFHLVTKKITGIPWIKLCIYGWNYGGYRQFQSRRSGLSGKAGSDQGRSDHSRSCAM
ncbi:MAG: solute carrier family 23 protein [Lachnospiraceae bacterium]